MPNDYGHKHRQDIIHNTPAFRMQQKLRRALETLGTRHVLHPVNRVKRAPHKTPEIQRTDIRKTIKREQARLAGMGALA